ncbi:MAG: type II toxin-antitoxin system VapC family toxin [bacterium]
MYFDTSALLKRYVSESGSERARVLQRTYRVVSSAVVPVEAASTLSRRKTLGNLTERQLSATLGRIRSDRVRWELVEVDRPVLSRAEELVMQTALRPLDAIHLASALTFVTMTGVRIHFVTADERQRVAAGAVGLDVIWVG